MDIKTSSYAHKERVNQIRFPIVPVFLVALGITLAGYAILGRGFAHLGVPPIFIGEIILASGLLTWALTGGTHVFRSGLSWIIVLLMVIGAIGTFRWIGTYGLDSLRDGALWGYGVFALLVGTFLLRGRDRILEVVRLYAKWLPWFLILVPIVMVTRLFFGELIPRWPVSNVPVIQPKGGDLAVHLSGAMAFLALGLVKLKNGRGQNWLLAEREWLLWGIFIIGAITILTGRAALLTMLTTAFLLFLFRPSKKWIKPVFLGIIVVTIAIVFDAEFEREDRKRSVSPQALVTTLESVFTETGGSEFDGSRRWRLAWWEDIWNYTARGEYFWTGKGYGINLADDDGYQVFGASHEQAVLRSPHNSHLTFLARSGVPGFTVWIALQVVFALALIQAYRKAQRQGLVDLANLNLWVLAYWWAFMVNAGFDVFLEGPQGGIWFWSLFGFGLALLIWQKNEIKNGSGNSTRIG